MLHWAYELPCQGKLPEFHFIPIVGCIRVFWLVLHPLGLDLDKALFFGILSVAQSVWRELESHISTSSKGLNEKHRLHAYVSTTVYDRSWKGMTEQFDLHFHEQFRQLDEVTPLKEHLPHSVRLTLLQIAVRSVPELRICRNHGRILSLTHSSSGHFSIAYDKYFMMVQNA